MKDNTKKDALLAKKNEPQTCLQILRGYKSGEIDLSENELAEVIRAGKNLSYLLTDDQILAKIFQQTKLANLWNGHWADYKSIASGEFALLMRLAYFTQKDPARIEALYRKSSLWELRQFEFEQYGEQTILAAIDKCKGDIEDIESVNDQPKIKASVKDHADIITEMRLADHIISEHGTRYRFDVHSGKWFRLENNWRPDSLRTLDSIISHTCKAAIEHVGDEKRASRIERWATASGVRQILQHETEMLRDTWDEDDFLLGTPGHTVDLLSGKTRPARYDDYLTKQTTVEPKNGKPERWLRFLDESTDNDSEMIAYIQKICGYLLTGSTKEHSLFFVHGEAGTGKTTFLETISNIMGDYATVAGMETFIHSNSDKHPTDLAMLAGARLVTASETEEGRSWAESKIKQLTGGDKISARFMRQDFFQFQPKFKIFIVGNYQPVLRNVDDAMRRRLHLLPFNHKPRLKDLDLKTKLMAEGGKILNWMIEGCLMWQKHGLNKPAIVQNATDRYFTEQDTLGQWIADCCVMGRDAQATPTKLALNYSEYTGEKISAKRMTAMLNRLSGQYRLTNEVCKTPGRKSTQRVWKGIGIQTDDACRNWQDTDNESVIELADCINERMQELADSSNDDVW